MSEPEGHWQPYDSSVALTLTFLRRGRCKTERNGRVATLELRFRSSRWSRGNRYFRHNDVTPAPRYWESTTCWRRTACAPAKILADYAGLGSPLWAVISYAGGI